MILFVFEGRKREPALFSTIQTLFFPKGNEHIVCSFGNNIYELYKELKALDDDGDIVALLKDRFKNEQNNPFKDLKSADFSEIYLFFDYDFQNKNLSLPLINQQIADMLSIFDNETENGKLYINYPMIESIRYTKELPDEQYHTYTVTQTDCHLFKHLAGEFSYYKNLNFIIIENNAHKAVTARRLEEVKNNWQYLTDMNVKKANYLCHNVLSYPASKSDINQLAIFNAQVKKYVSATPVSIAVLNAFPLFIYEYFK